MVVAVKAASADNRSRQRTRRLRRSSLGTELRACRCSRCPLGAPSSTQRSLLSCRQIPRWLMRRPAHLMRCMDTPLQCTTVTPQLPYLSTVGLKGSYPPRTRPRSCARHNLLRAAWIGRAHQTAFRNHHQWTCNPHSWSITSCRSGSQALRQQAVVVAAAAAVRVRAGVDFFGK